jgi:hypothetical protein
MQRSYSPKATASSFIYQHIAVNRLTAITHLIRDLLWAPLFMKAVHHFIPVFVLDSDRITEGQEAPLY